MACAVTGSTASSAATPAPDRTCELGLVLAARRCPQEHQRAVQCALGCIQEDRSWKETDCWASDPGCINVFLSVGAHTCSHKGVFCSSVRWESGVPLGDLLHMDRRDLCYSTQEAAVPCVGIQPNQMPKTDSTNSKCWMYFQKEKCKNQKRVQSICHPAHWPPSDLGGSTVIIKGLWTLRGRHEIALSYPSGP